MIIGYTSLNDKFYNNDNISFIFDLRSSIQSFINTRQIETHSNCSRQPTHDTQSFLSILSRLCCGFRFYIYNSRDFVTRTERNL